MNSPYSTTKNPNFLSVPHKKVCDNWGVEPTKPKNANNRDLVKRD
jgi:hypothetical protein